MLDSLTPISISKKSTIISLLIALGAENISSISNCMSRIRLTVTNPKIISNDDIFLKLKAKGVIRNDNSIHLIFGHQSAMLAQELKNTLQAINNKELLDLFYQIQGTKNIAQTIYTKDKIKIYIKKTIQYETQFKVIDNCIEIDNESDLDKQIQYLILYWDFIQGKSIFSCIQKKLIKDINFTNYNIHISLHSAINFDNINYTGMDISRNSIDSSELVINDATEDLYNTILEYYHFEKK